MTITENRAPVIASAGDVTKSVGVRDPQWPRHSLFPIAPKFTNTKSRFDPTVTLSNWSPLTHQRITSWRCVIASLAPDCVAGVSSVLLTINKICGRVPLRIDRELNVRFAGMLTPFL
jgi:hypothetical protein